MKLGLRKFCYIGNLTHNSKTPVNRTRLTETRLSATPTKIANNTVYGNNLKARAWDVISILTQNICVDY